MKKTIKGNTLEVKDGKVIYTTHDNLTVSYGVSEYEENGDHVINEAIFNLADNNQQGYELVERFDAWLRGRSVDVTMLNPYCLYQINYQLDLPDES